MPEFKRISIGFSLCFSLFPVIVLAASGTLQDADPGRDDISSFNRQFEEFAYAVEAMLVWRVQSNEFYEKIANQETLTARDLRIIQNDGAQEYLRLRAVLLKIVEEYKHVSDASTSIEISTGKATGERIEKTDYIGGGEKYNYVINPTDELGIDYIKRAKTAFTASLILYDNYVLSVINAQKNKKLRHIINLYLEGDDANQLEEVSENFGSLANFTRINRVIPYALEMMEWEKSHPDSKLVHDEVNQYLNNLIEQSYAFSKIPQLSVLDVAKWNLGRLLDDIDDELSGTSSFASNELSKFFGNTIGMFESRKGKLHDMPKAEQEAITQQLKPLDILLEKTPFRLTDKFIPGHWGHVAIWMGTETELKDLGIWDSLSAEYQKAIRDGRSILEALRPGVQLNTFEHFLNIDDFAVLRVKEGYLDNDTMIRYLRNGFEQVHKEYDFNFDVETLDKIVCSETVYVTYDDDYWNWPTSATLGRVTISPDNVAEKVAGVSINQRLSETDKVLQTIFLYHDGKVVKQRVREVFNLLMNQRYDLARTKLD